MRSVMWVLHDSLVGSKVQVEACLFLLAFAQDSYIMVLVVYNWMWNQQENKSLNKYIMFDMFLALFSNNIIFYVKCILLHFVLITKVVL